MNVFQAEPGTWAGVLVSFLAMGVAIWQALVAKQQAKLAKTAADDSRRQAVAAEAQVTIMQEQLNGENADRAEARRPRFNATASPMDYSDANQRYAEIVLTQTGGLPCHGSSVGRPVTTWRECVRAGSQTTTTCGPSARKR